MISATRWRLWLLPALLLAAVLHRATETHFERSRAILSTTTLAPVGEAIQLPVPETPNGAWPTALILRIRNRSAAPVQLGVVVRDSEVARPGVPASRERRFDLDLPPRRAPNEPPGHLEITGPGDWVLEYVEVANLYGYSHGIVAFLVLPAGSAEYLRPATASRWLMTLMLLSLAVGQRPVQHRAGRRLHLALAALVVVFIALTLVAPVATSYAIVVSWPTWLLFAVLVHAPAVVQVWRDFLWPALTRDYLVGVTPATFDRGERPDVRWTTSGWVRVVAGLMLGLASLLFIAARIRSLEPFFDESDISVLGLYTNLALHGDLLVGPYSRFNWHHPGPMYFYLLSPLYWLTNRHLLSLAWTAALMNLGCVWLLFNRLNRRGGVGMLLAGASLLALLLLQVEGLLTNPWNPYVTVLPLAALIVLCADFASSVRVGTLPLIVLLASFLTQTHVGYVPCVGATVLVSVGLHLRFRWRAGVAPTPDPIRDRWLLIVSAVLLLVVWAPPVVENLTHDPGNLTRLYEFFRHPESSPGSDAVGAFVHVMSAPVMWGLKLDFGRNAALEFGWLAGGVVLAQLLLLWPVSRWARRRGRDFHAALCLISLIGSLAALWSVSRIAGAILAHLVFWVCVFALINVTAIVAIVTCQGWDYIRTRRVVPVAWRARAWPSWLPAALALVAAAYYLPRLADQQRQSGVGSLGVKVMAGEFDSYLNQQGIQRPLLRIGRSAWGIAAGVILEQFKAGRVVVVASDWTFMFSDAFATNGREDAQFDIVDGSSGLQTLLEYEPVAKDEHFTIFRRLTLGAVRRLSLPGRIISSTGISGNPDLIVDGIALADGSDWNAKGTVRFAAEGASVTIAVPATATGVALSVDGNDGWRLDCVVDGSAVDHVGFIRAGADHGLRTREGHFRRLTTCQQLRLSPRFGDGMYSMSEVTFLTATVYRGPGQ